MGNYLSPRWRKLVNPIDWMMPLYKAIGANNPILSTLGVFVLAGGFFGGWWMLTGREYREQQNKKSPVVQATTYATSNNDETPVIRIEGSSDIHFKGGSVTGVNRPAISVKNSKNVTTDNTAIREITSVIQVEDDSAHPDPAHQRMVNDLIEEYRLKHPRASDQPKPGHLRPMIDWINTKLKQRGETFTISEK
jgi:hypothetical protein